MNKQNLVGVLTVTTLTALLMAGCGSTEGNQERDNSHQRVEIDELAGEVTDDGQADVTNQEAIEAAQVDGQEDITSIEGDASYAEYDMTVTYVVPHYFMLHDGDIYFHGPDAEGGLDAVALGGRFMSQVTANTVLYRFYTNFEEVVPQVFDYSGGHMYMCGDYICYQSGEYESSASDGPINIRMENIEGEDEFDDIDTTSLYILGGGEDSLVAYTYVGAGDMPGDYAYYFKGGRYRGNFHMEDMVSFVGVLDDQILYVGLSDDECHLFQIDTEGDATIDLGALPSINDGASNYGSSRAFAYSDNGKVYFSYAFYEGSGGFYAGGYYVTASLYEADSVTYSEAAGTSEEREDIPGFIVCDGQMVMADGTPGTADVIDDTIGYYGEDGVWTPVADGYGFEYLDDEWETLREVEVCEYVDGYIYAVINELEHVPEDDIGWRYAYRRTSSKVVAINVASGSEINLVEVY